VTASSSYTGIVSETRFLFGFYTNAFGPLPPNVSCYPSSPSRCLIFGRVMITCVAGAAECRQCRVSSWITVQNDTALTVSPSIEALAAISMMPITGAIMLQQNTSLPQTIDNLEGYITELLIRSYSASWTYARLFIYDSSLSTDVLLPIPTSRANVSLWRVWLWLWLNLLFLFAQRVSGQRLVGSTGLAALLLDTTPSSTNGIALSATFRH